MKHLIVFGGLFAVLGLGIGVGNAQPAHSGKGPVMDDERVSQMTKMMEEMQEQMKGMREQMQGSGPMHGHMGHMMGQMGRMRAMMDQHRGQMMQHCPAPTPSR
jgi:hypothetical protein